MSKKLEKELLAIQETITEEEETGYGTCEECACELTYPPSGSWGVGYVCVPCAKRLRGEYE